MQVLGRQRTESPGSVRFCRPKSNPSRQNWMEARAVQGCALVRSPNHKKAEGAVPQPVMIRMLSKT